ncbi:hypothetical protein CDD83_5486 [Cordyceps sp. RAO-2017]|nr:hypothetical protein CDD83_5486 [Cordyceps sp. RAO-2017]
MSYFEAQVQKSATRNAELLQLLAETDHASPALEQHMRFIEDLDCQIRDSDERLRSLSSKRDSGLKEHQRFRDSHVRRFVYKAAGKENDFTSKAEKGEREYIKVLQKVERENCINEGLKDQRKEAGLARRELERSAKRNSDAQRKLNELYHAIFTGPTPQFPEEDEAEQRCERLVQRCWPTATA